MRHPAIRYLPCFYSLSAAPERPVSCSSTQIGPAQTPAPTTTVSAPKRSTSFWRTGGVRSLPSRSRRPRRSHEQTSERWRSCASRPGRASRPASSSAPAREPHRSATGFGRSQSAAYGPDQRSFAIAPPRRCRSRLGASVHRGWIRSASFRDLTYRIVAVTPRVQKPAPATRKTAFALRARM
jgi:hypothetical protein